MSLFWHRIRAAVYMVLAAICLQWLFTHINSSHHSSVFFCCCGFVFGLMYGIDEYARIRKLEQE